MSDYIEREKALKAVEDIVCDADDAERTCDRIIDIPAADVGPIRHGRWNRGACSECGGIKPMTVTPANPGGTSQGNFGGGIQKIEIPPIKIKFEGAIRLDGTSQNLDLNQLMNNKDFVTQFSQMISRQIEDNLQGGYFKDTRKNKFPTF